MNKFKEGDVVTSNCNISGIISFVGYGWYKIEKDGTEYVFSRSQLEIDKQYYREQRLKGLLDEI